MNSIPCVILAGGKGTRLAEETTSIPKPMLDVGGKPLLQHVMDIYMMQGVNNFIIPVGHKKEYVYGYFHSIHPINVSVNMGDTSFDYHGYRVRVVDTGEDTLTGGRLARLEYLLRHTAFHFTYGDGLGNVNIRKVYSAIEGAYDLACITTVHPEGRFGRAIITDQDRVVKFGEKVESETDWINGGFSVLRWEILSSVLLHGGDQCNLEKDIYPLIAASNFMTTVRHTGFWHCVDTLRDLEDIRHTYDKEGAVWLKL
jgi:glucose-1-phosphate cytidylyltransferase